ncbi:phosphoribosylanthranilate isomerase [Ruminococcus sp.]|uniref:phosphoribosylanthranilate isomerase n=1 Tax=Ruminococcus sp. TaxID=41978 RepID=UPI003865C017
MTKIKLCGLSRPCDILTANELMPEYIGFVFAPKSKRYIDPQQAARLKELLSPDIRAVGVFVDEAPDTVTALLNSGVIDIAQLHGGEDEAYIQRLRQLADKPIIKAFQIKSRHDLNEAEACTADHILLDSGAGTGNVFDWSVLQDVKRPYFLAGGLSPDNVGDAVRLLHPYAVDVSSGIETDGRKDEEKAAAFIAAVRKEE